MGQKIFAFIAGLSFFLLAGWAGYAFYPDGHRGNPPSAADNVLASTDIRINPIEDDRAESTASDTPAPELDVLRYMRWYSEDGASGQLKACLAFDRDLPRGQETSLSTFIDISPDTPFAVSVTQNSLCLGGLSYDTEYRVTVKQGLPSQDSDVVLAADKRVSLSFGDKPAFVGFTDNGIILPKTDAGGLAIETVNVSQLDVTVERVNHRILSQSAPNAGEQSIEGQYSYSYDAWQEKVEVWSGVLDVANKRNETVRTIFPLQDITQDLNYGAYIVTAKRASDKENQSRVAQAWRWIVSTDMALTSYRGADTTHVNVRSLKSARLMDGVRLELIAQNNDLLGEVITNADGRAKFASAMLDGQGNMAPKMIFAYGPDNDFAMLDLSRSPLDMTAYDIEGRTAHSPIDIFAYTERGIYRPGENVYLTALLRGDTAEARFDRPVNVVISKPDGGIAFKQSYESREQAGALAIHYDLPSGAPRGLWTISITPEGMENGQSVRFDVQDFVPQKLKLNSELDQEVLSSTSRASLNMQADFLYGAPGKNLDAEAEARVQIENQPFADFKEFEFGDTQETFEERIVEIGVGVTDKTGALSLPINLRAEKISSSFPLRLMVTSGVAEPGGRYVRRTDYVPLRTQESYIGFKPNFDGRYASHKNPVSLDLVHVSSDGTVLPTELNWQLVEEVHDFQWYRENGRWRYRKDVSEAAIVSGQTAIEASPKAWMKRLPRGQYRLDAMAENGVKGSIRFNVGWARPSNGVDAPDRIVMGKVEDSVSAGDIITLSVDAPYAGRGDLVIANETVQSIQSVVLPEGESELSFKFNENWGDSVYAMLTLYTPEAEDGKSIQRRAAGVSYIALDRTAQILDVSFDAPEKIEPRQTYELSVAVDNVPKGEKAWISVAAVDEGILQLTQYKTPDAERYFFGKKAFGLDVRDDYARLLNPNLGLAAILPQGGDSVGGAGLSVVPTQTVSLYQAPMTLKNGQAVISLEIPDFQGKLRLMATAWTQSAVGSAEGSLIIRDPVPVTVGLPRFLAPGDKAVATVSLDNLDGPVGEYSIATISELAANDNQASANLDRNERKDFLFPIEAQALGVSNFDLSIKGPQNYALNNSRQIETRSPFRPRVSKNLTRLAPGETYALNASRLEGFIPEATDVTLAVSNLPGLDAQTYINALSVYPYGCTEQTTSRAMPLLFVSELGGIAGLDETQRKARIDIAIKRLIARQDSDGAFGLWRVGDGNSSPWLQAYVTEFLWLAKERGQSVPDEAMKKALKAVQKISQPNSYSNLALDFNYGWARNGGIDRDARRYERAAYAHYVLALAGQVDVPDLRYLADNRAEHIKRPLAMSYLATALSKIGDDRRAKALFESALMERDMGKSNRDDYYASGLRNAAAITATAYDYLSEAQASKLLQYIVAWTEEDDYLNTQEQSYLVRMIAALISKRQLARHTNGREQNAY